MAYTNAQLVRRTVGDSGTPITRYFSGDGSTKLFYLSTALLGTGYAVYVGSTLKTETTDYTLDRETGILEFVAAPAAGTNNIRVAFRAVELSDGDITEALRQRGLVDTDTAETGYPAGMLSAAADLAEWVAAKWTYRYDSSIDGQSLSRSQVAAAWSKMAIDLRAKSRTFGGLSTTSIVKIDGYNYNEVAGRDVLATSPNVRQRYYYVDTLDNYP